MTNNNTGTDRWRVANYQIPVPIGDCSAHFLINKEDDNKVKNAFLMDGGTNAGGYQAWAQILKGLRLIDLELGSDWKFDSWVVTHWDEDHYRGVQELLSCPARMTRCIRHLDEAVTGRTTPSTFRQQYFTAEPWLLCGALDHVMFDEKKGEKDGRLKFLHPFMSDPTANLTTVMKDALKTVHKDEIVQSQHIIQSAGLRCITTAPLVGIDLFSRTRQFNLDGETCPQMQSADDLLWNIMPDPKSVRPRFCVVGANGYGIGKAEPYQPQPSRNETSILALLFWPGPAGSGCCSYFTGGDGHPVVERNIVDRWMQNNNDEFKPHGTEITDIVINKMKPKGLLVTPGNRHGHPTWDVLLELSNYFKACEGEVGLFTTRSFYWLDANAPPAVKKLNFNHNEIPFMQELYKQVHNEYQEDDDDDSEVVLNDLIVLDQKERVEIQAEFEAKKREFGKKLAERENSGIDKKGKIDWTKVQDVITEQCGMVRMMKDKPWPEEVIISPELFWAWLRWVETVYAAQREGSQQYEEICWQPIVNEGNPHYLLSFSFEENGKQSKIEVFTDDGEYQFAQEDDGFVTSQKTNLIVVDGKAAPWTKYVYTPLGIATIFAGEDVLARTDKEPSKTVKNLEVNKSFLTLALKMNIFADGDSSNPPSDKATKKSRSGPKQLGKKESVQEGTKEFLRKKMKLEERLIQYKKDQSAYQDKTEGIIDSEYKVKAGEIDSLTDDNLPLMGLPEEQAKWLEDPKQRDYIEFLVGYFKHPSFGEAINTDDKILVDDVLEQTGGSGSEERS
ncbi:hypothetical protein E4U41_003891 [Claviceps citrina]|nr:hypothetical protein E4U41_003891 [Claviceps citrina]